MISPEPCEARLAVETGASQGTSGRLTTQQQFPLLAFYPLPSLTTARSMSDATFHGGLMRMASREQQTPWHSARQDCSSAGHTKSLTIGDRRIGPQPRQSAQRA